MILTLLLILAGNFVSQSNAILRSDQLGCGLKLEVDGVLKVGGVPWTTLGKACFRFNGEEKCEEASFSSELLGFDALGSFREKRGRIHVDDKRWNISYKAFDGINAISFAQYFPDELFGTNFPGNSPRESGRDGLSSWFPSFRTESVEESPLKGVLRFQGFMTGKRFRVERWGESMEPLDGHESGPIVLFSEKCAVVMSSSGSFMSSSNMYSRSKGELGFGVMGSVKRIPRGHRAETILVGFDISNKPDGIREAMLFWGNTLRTLYGTKRARDVTVEYLQYSTDNGAYYYYHTENGMNYEDTILAVKEYAELQNIPFRQWLMDSWWYYKGTEGGVKNWTAMPHIFPHGIAYLQRKTGWDIVAHNRYWSANSDYARQNGGEFEFLTFEGYALPIEQRFWDYLFQESKKWGLTVYEQDWLNIQFENFLPLLEEINLGKDWMLQMGEAAKNHNVNIQLCMALPREIMQSIEMPAVTQARVSDDYQPGNENWQNVGVTSMFAQALGITPTKDNFWSTPNTSFPDRYGGSAETASRLHAIVSTLSTGPVAPSDKIGFINRDLVMRSCAENGKLLRPDVPAVRLDKTFFAQAGISTGAVEGEVWITKTTLSGVIFSYVLSASSPAFQLLESDIYGNKALVKKEFVVWELDADFFPQSLPIQISATTKLTSRLFCAAPVFSNGWVFLGEALTKWVPVSNDRFSQLAVTSNGFGVRVHGEPNEVVHIKVRSPAGRFIDVLCRIPSNGVTRFSSQILSCGWPKIGVVRESLTIQADIVKMH